MTTINTERADIQGLLQQMRAMKAQTEAVKTPLESGPVNPLQQTQEPQKSFGDLLSSAVNSVNETQQHSSTLATAYERGEPGVSLEQVMVASQKASVSFQALTQVRNRLVEAYQDVMNMPI